MKPTKEFKEWYISKYNVTKHDMATLVPYVSFLKLSFEFQEGVYREYFREKGWNWLNVTMNNKNNTWYGDTYHNEHKKQLVAGYKTYPEAFEALVNKLFSDV